jgi:hypothetical protein
MKKHEQNSLQIFQSKRLIRINEPKGIFMVRDTRSPLANLIYLFQKGDINSVCLKTMCYVLIKFFRKNWYAFIYNNDIASCKLLFSK